MLKCALEQVKTDPHFWKLAILASHSALQGACVCILSGTDGTGALDKNSRRKTLRKLYGEEDDDRFLDDDSVEFPEARTASLLELLERLPGNLRIEMPSRNQREWNYDVAGDLRRLHQFRNKFTHFPPSGWSIEISGLPRIIGRSVDLTRRISTSGNYRGFNRFRDMNLGPLLLEIEGLLGSA